MRLLAAGTSAETERIKILEEKRNGTLDEIHLKQQQLDRLDYLRFDIKRSKKDI